MTAARVRPRDVESYLDVAAAGNGRTGVRMTLDLLDRGSTFDDVIVNLLGAAQHEAGQRWMRSSWSVVEEHVVSGVTQKALDALSGTLDEEPTTGPVVVTCAEGDWHSLAGQMFAEQLRGRGVAVVFLGASTPARHVEEFLSRHRAEALAISCNLPLFFGGVVSLVAAAHAHGIPVLAGGRGLGAGPLRSNRLGVDAWADGIDAAIDVLNSWRRDPPALSKGGALLDPRAIELNSLAPELGERAFESLELSMPALSAYNDAQRARTLEDLVSMVRFTAAARMVDEPAVLSEFLTWLLDVLRPRGVPSHAVVAGLVALEPSVSKVDPAAGRLVLAAAHAAAQSPT
ncbi:MAG: cobalamin-dependent protein [Candidatus Phosphoribacter sp.]